MTTTMFRGLPLVGQEAASIGESVWVHQIWGPPLLVQVEKWQGSLPGRPMALTIVLPRERRPHTTMIAVDYAEREQVLAERGPDGVNDVAGRLIDLLTGHLAAAGPPASTMDGRVLIPVGHRRGADVSRRLQRAVEAIHKRGLDLPDGTVTVTPAVGWATAPTLGPRAVPELADQALTAAQHGRRRLDGVPHRWGDEARRENRILSQRTQLQIVLTTFAALLWPAITVGLSVAVGIKPADWAFTVVIGALTFTAGSIWLETVLSLRRVDPPALDPADRPYVTAIIAAYLPNEAATILDTIDAFLRVDYDRPQIIVAYNTPKRLPMEVTLRALAARHERLTVIEVPFSTSKAQNVNAALHVATGDIIGVFDADHHPDPNAFDRAAAWIAGGADIVQGRCLVRNADDSPISSVVAAEFDVLYGVSHLGRARLHGFAIFGGSNGFWRADLIRRLRLRPDMLTEDIDSSIRALLDGAELVYDPDLLSTELAPSTAQAWWRQRARWAQGWVQVTTRHLLSCVRSPALTVRQRLGAALLLGWREVAPWMTLAVLPLLVYALWFDGEPGLPLNLSMLWLAAAFTTLAGPFQTWVAYRTTPVAHRGPVSRYVVYGLLSILAYTELKNVVARVAQVKQLAGERAWVITPRSVGVVVPSLPSGSEVSE